jgi:hypothetical protein
MSLAMALACAANFSQIAVFSIVKACARLAEMAKPIRMDSRNSDSLDRMRPNRTFDRMKTALFNQARMTGAADGRASCAQGAGQLSLDEVYRKVPVFSAEPGGSLGKRTYAGHQPSQTLTSVTLVASAIYLSVVCWLPDTTACAHAVPRVLDEAVFRLFS